MRHATLAALLTVYAVTAAAQGLEHARTAHDDRLADEHYKTGWELLTTEQWDAAAKEFQSAIDLNDRFKLAYYGLGRANMGAKRFSTAITAYEKCRDLYQAQGSQNFANKAEADRMLADDVLQIDREIARLQSSPQTPNTAIYIAQLNNQKARLQNRTHGSETISLSTPVPAFISLALGSAYLRSERFPDAEKAYRQALDADGKYGEAHSNLAALYLITGRYADASREVTAAEKAGYKVNPGLKDEIKKKSGS